MTNEYTLKRCPRCGRKFPATTEFFYADNTGHHPDGLSSLCKSCDKLLNASNYRRRIEEPREALPPGQKRCGSCLKLAPANSANFALDKRNPDGLSSLCRACKKKVDARYYQRKKARIKDGKL